MKKYLVAKSKVSFTECSEEDLDPQFRKATANMRMAASAVQRVLSQYPNIEKEKIAVIFATHFGEVESTLDFLMTYKESNVARPILFQNSLHNSTLGFVSIYCGLSGPGMTISADAETVSATAHCLETMLHANEFVLVCFVDYIPDSLSGNYLQQHPYLRPHFNQAKAYLFSTQVLDIKSQEVCEQLNRFYFEAFE